MRLVSRRAVFRSVRQRSVSAALLAAYVVTAAGVPLPSGVLSQKGGESYPCAGGACGCRSAEQCWRSCCCHTLAERFQWAREHGTRPPEYAIAMARQAGLELAWLEDSSAAGAAGGAGIRVEVCSAMKKPPAEPGAVGVRGTAPARCQHCMDRHERAKKNSKQTNFIIGWRAIQCKGHSSNWLAAVPTLIVASCGLSSEPSLIIWLEPALSDHADCVAECPALPPPETV